MPIKRSYADHGDACATAHAMELLGDRWTYPVIRELMLAPKRFRELADGLQGVTPAVLTARLREMEAHGLVAHRLQESGVATYELTPWARELEPTFQALGRWAQRSPSRAEEGSLTPDAMVQSLRTMAPRGPMRPRMNVQLDLRDARIPRHPGYRYRLTWGPRGFDAQRGTMNSPDAVVTGDSSALGDVLWRGAALDGSGLAVTGDTDAVRRLVAAFRESA